MDRTDALPTRCPRCGTPTELETGPPAVELGDLTAPPAFGHDVAPGPTVPLVGALPEDSEALNLDELGFEAVEPAGGPPTIGLKPSAPPGFTGNEAWADEDALETLDLPEAVDDADPDRHTVAPVIRASSNPFAPPPAPPARTSVIAPVRSVHPSLGGTPTVQMPAVTGDSDSAGTTADLPAPVRSAGPPRIVPAARNASDARAATSTSNDLSDGIAPKFAPAAAVAPFRVPGSAPRDPGFGQEQAVVLDLPTPIEFAHVDLPAPAESNLPVPAQDNLLAPASLELAPSETGLLTPVEAELAAIDQELRPADQLPFSPASNDAGLPPQPVSPASIDSRPALDHRRSPPPRKPGRSSMQRLVWIAAAGFGILAIGVGALVASGVFDSPADPIIAAGAGAGTPTRPRKMDATESDQQRSQDFRSALALDTPEGYLNAATLARSQQDSTAEAEARLLYHVRFGPDDGAREQAERLLASPSGKPSPQLDRVNALAALARDDLAGADALLQGDEPRTGLYRGWLRLRQRRDQDAVAEADAIIALVPGDPAAIALRHEAAAGYDPSAAFAGVQASLKGNDDHPGLLLGAVRVGIRVGELRAAEQWLDHASDKFQATLDKSAVFAVLRARLAAAAGSYNRAVAEYDEAVRLAPHDVSLKLSRIAAMHKAGQLVEASAAIESMLRDAPENVDALLLKGAIAVDAGQGDEALQVAETLVAKLPKSPQPLFLRGRVRAMRLQVDESRADFAAALTIDPTFVAANIHDARLLATVDRLAEGLEVLDQAQAGAASRHSAPDQVDILTAKAELLDKAERVPEAQAALDQALSILPTDNHAQLARGLLRLRTGDAEAGTADLLAIYRRTGAYAGLTAPLGRIFAREGNIDDLEQLVEQIGDLDNASLEDLIVGAQLKLARAKPDEARTLLTRALALAPNDWEANMLMAQALLEGGQPEDALVQIDRSHPTIPSAQRYVLRGKILEYNGKHDEARTEYLRALQVDDSMTEARFLYGRLLAYVGEAQAAIDELEKVVTTGDGYPAAWLNLGRARRELGERDAAIRDLKKALELDASQTEAHYLMGRTYFEQNNAAGATKALKQAAEAAPNDALWLPDALVFLGRAEAQQGHVADAKQAFSRMLKLVPPDHPSRKSVEQELANLR